MNAAGKLSLYGAGLAVAFAGAFGAAGALVPQSLVDSWKDAASAAGEHDMGSGSMQNGSSQDGSSSTADEVKTAEVDGYTLNIAGHMVTEMTTDLVVSVDKSGAAVTLDEAASAVIADASTFAPLTLDTAATVEGSDIRFSVTVPDATRYVIFVEFTVDGQPRTAQFALNAMSAEDMNMGGN